MVDKVKRTKFQQGYAEGVSEGTASTGARLIMKATDKLLQGTTMDRRGKVKEGYEVGKQDARDAMKYQATESKKRTLEMKKDEDYRRQKMKGL